MSKSADAFRTISEVAEWLDTPAHVLRFWESKFTQVKPVKRAGGRRYYRPSDMLLLGGIKKLLHEDGMTIKGAQKILREQGIKHVSSLCTLSVGDEDIIEDVVLQEVPASEPVDTVVPFAKPAESDTVDDATEEIVAHAEDAMLEVSTEDENAPADAQIAESDASDTEPVSPEEEALPEPETAVEDTLEADAEPDKSEDLEPEPETAALPGFLQKSMEERIEVQAEEAETEAAVADPTPEPAVVAPEPKEPAPSVLSHLSRIRTLSPESAKEIAPIVEKLRARVG
ncbi:MerR family transcriptional regulator [Marivita hallyeonensis]|uniref:MerR HTH family regulatory protein n=1 Tax=Marivita hallyeonensis TaxID=996342 RepID=A0A1M5QLN5_9RHOB|nr:MerR family transcriptional regulator [Marivita hallyeonensis]SHH15014.1 MerR HTH family regulatory protein [Marivita hallyeonensis]